jgi:hypothetical protein
MVLQHDAAEHTVWNQMPLRKRIVSALALLVAVREPV